jgi:diacylglycerol kinase family enzyme
VAPQAPDLVIAAGGDGTVRTLLAALAQSNSQTPVGIVPMGTGNILARNLGIFEDNLLVDPLQKALNIICTGTTIPMDMGIMNGQYFSVAAGAGPMSDAIITPAHQDKANWKMLAYATSMVQTFAVRPIVFSVTADDTTFQVSASGIFVTNVANFGMGVLSATALPDDGLLDLCILDPAHFGDYLHLGFHFSVGSFGDEPYYIRKVKNVTLNVMPIKSPMSALQKFRHKIRAFMGGQDYKDHQGSRHSQATAMIDGDACGSTPMTIGVAPHAVTLVVPRELRQT